MTSAIEVDEAVQALLKELEAMEGYSTAYFPPQNSEQQPPPSSPLKQSVVTQSSKPMPWKCPYCEESFTTRDRLRHHHRRHRHDKKRRSNRSSQPKSPHAQISAGIGPQEVSATCDGSSCVNDKTESAYDNAPEESGDYAAPSPAQTSEGGPQNVSVSCVDGGSINDNGRSDNPPELSGDFGLVGKDSNDSPPTVSWVDAGYQYTVQNPTNRGNVFLNIQLYHGTQHTHGCKLYLDEIKDYGTYVMVMDIITRLENLWVDRYSGVPRVTGLIQTVVPIAARCTTDSNEGVVHNEDR